MKRFSQFIAEGNPLNRLQHHIDSGRSFSVLTSDRKGLSKQENRARMKDLQARLRARGYGFKKAKGSYEGEEENSLVVYAKGVGGRDARRLKRDTSKLGTQFGQDSVFYHKGQRAKLIGTSPTGSWPGKGHSKPIGKVAMNRPDEPFQTEFNPTKPKAQRPRFTTVSTKNNG